MAEQLTFNLPVRESRARGDFFVSTANALAVARLDDPETWPNRKLVLVGPEGSGKTHLAHVWAETAGAVVLKPSGLSDIDIPGIAQPVVLDDADGASPDAEEAMFHLHNHLSASGLSFLLVAYQPPARWGLRLPDLQSRMEATDSVRIDSPDDALLAAVMVKQFADRQLRVDPAVVSWLTAHMDRSFQSARSVVEALDQAALTEGRAITRPLAQKVLNRMGAA